ncbi:MAG TPA: hypothetical protein PKD53_06665 [Chloroflexaceae bacterium]|nr:hypothetical protein [Chloroflexaceae bacterium]
MTARRVTFQGWKCRVVRASYGNTGRIALPLYDVEDGSPVATATVNMPELSLALDEVVIKNYSENEGMLDLLMAEGIISPPLGEVSSGYVTLYICRCLL